VRSLLLLTELAPVIGNDKASKIAHHAMDRDLMQTEDSIVGTGAGKRCRDMDRRKIDLGQRRRRQRGRLPP
jgi:fumarate hydratase class II